ncbi:sugar phosphate isomerase/epimerase [Streptomyces sp. Root1310]|uniref:sugar phosphate isomerase/epimerase family protein n=1 Tax=Streptomyces sp. Root1310 TaxID=1736452 RepID=UPI00070D134C|nr:sugar phosphate isomerase/epimerase [Streptomyces sp. Root1310]KQX69491.1 sugar phosphate isomerase [Streptomyces sp. Root1310]
MKLGMLTACLPTWPLKRIADWAAKTGYERLEVAVWPGTGGRAFEASHIDVTHFDAREREHVQRLLQETGLDISALAYYENNLHPDTERREQIRAHLKHAIDTAQALGVPHVGTFIGRDPARSVPENQREAERVLPELIEYAGERGVKLLIENCVMEGWHPDGHPGNIAYSPELWEWMFSLGLYLNWDPSHLMWLGIDPLTTITPYAGRIVHAQAKDIELDPVARNRYGVFGTTAKNGDPWATGWWRYRVPGRGQVDWTRVVDRLYEAGFTGTLSVEHEDPLWGGTPEKVCQGLTIAHHTLRPLVVA